MWWQLEVVRRSDVSSNLARVLLDGPSAPVTVTSHAIVAISPASPPMERVPYYLPRSDARLGLLGVVRPAPVHTWAPLAPLLQVGEHDHCTCLEQGGASTCDASLPRSRLPACVPRQTRRAADEVGLVVAPSRPLLHTLMLEACTTLALYRPPLVETRGLRTCTDIVVYEPRRVTVDGLITSQALVPLEHGAIVIYQPQRVLDSGVRTSSALVVYQPPLLNYGLQPPAAVVTTHMGMLVLYTPPTPALPGPSQLVTYTPTMTTELPALAAEDLTLHGPTTDLLVRRFNPASCDLATCLPLFPT